MDKNDRVRLAAVLGKLTAAATAACMIDDDDDGGAFLCECEKAGLERGLVLESNIINILLSLDDSAAYPWTPNWLQCLFDAIPYKNPDAPQDPTQLSRLRQCLMAIPDHECYAALVREYSGSWPASPRPGRPDDVTDTSCVSADTLVKRAFLFLQEPARIAYVCDGRSDLQGYFTDDAIEWLNKIHVYVKADLRRFRKSGGITTTLTSGENAPSPHVLAQIFTSKAYEDAMSGSW